MSAASRCRTVELFEFDYQLEMYKPAARRRWGYFALSILYPGPAGREARLDLALPGGPST